MEVIEWALSRLRKGNELPCQEIIDEIKYQVQRRVIAKQGFTAWDITQELRQQNIRGYHSDFKQVVHNMFEAGDMSGYNRELRDMGGPELAWFYYHTHDYASQQYASSPAPTPLRTTPIVRSRTLVSGDPNDDEDGIVACADKRGTVCVPSKAIRALGLQPGMSAVAIPCRVETKVSIEKPRNDVPANARWYTVDRDCNIRVTQGVFAEAYCFGPRFNVDIDSGSVLLTTLK